MNRRIRTLQKMLAREKLDGFLVTSLTNIRYLCGFTGSNGMMLVTRTKAMFYTDFRYQEQIKTEVKGCSARVLERDLYASFPVEDLKNIRRLGVEKTHLTLARFELLRQQLKKTKFIPCRDLVLELRRKKSPEELQLIIKAQRMTERVFRNILSLIKPGVTEKDLAMEIEFQFRRAGEPAFPVIVASGENAAKPHARPGGRRLRRGDCITFDLGCRIDGYASDMTRTVFLGSPDPQMRQVYEAVLTAQQEALEIIKPGVPCKLVDLAARDSLLRAGLAQFFGHGLGHGVGLDVHEQPSLAKNSTQTLESGDVVTVEPGVYIPDKGGVRIEDMVFLTRNGCLNLTSVSKKMLIL